jgi:hypothetical protein
LFKLLTIYRDDNSLEKTLDSAYTVVNNSLDELRRCIYLENTVNLIKVIYFHKIKAIGVLFLIITLHEFSTLFVCLLIFDIYVVSRNPIVDDSLRDLYDKLYKQSSDLALKYIPRYVQKK